MARGLGGNAPRSARGGLADLIRERQREQEQEEQERQRQARSRYREQERQSWQRPTRGLGGAQRRAEEQFRQSERESWTQTPWQRPEPEEKERPSRTIDPITRARNARNFETYGGSPYSSQMRGLDQAYERAGSMGLPQRRPQRRPGGLRSVEDERLRLADVERQAYNALQDTEQRQTEEEQRRVYGENNLPVYWQQIKDRERRNQAMGLPTAEELAKPLFPLPRRAVPGAFDQNDPNLRFVPEPFTGEIPKPTPAAAPQATQLRPWEANLVKPEQPWWMRYSAPQVEGTPIISPLQLISSDPEDAVFASAALLDYQQRKAERERADQEAAADAERDINVLSLRPDSIGTMFESGAAHLRKFAAEAGITSGIANFFDFTNSWTNQQLAVPLTFDDDQVVELTGTLQGEPGGELTLTAAQGFVPFFGTLSRMFRPGGRTVNWMAYRGEYVTDPQTGEKVWKGVDPNNPGMYQSGPIMMAAIMGRAFNAEMAKEYRMQAALNRKILEAPPEQRETLALATVNANANSAYQWNTYLALYDKLNPEGLLHKADIALSRGDISSANYYADRWRMLSSMSYTDVVDHYNQMSSELVMSAVLDPTNFADIGLGWMVDFGRGVWLLRSLGKIDEATAAAKLDEAWKLASDVERAANLGKRISNRANPYSFLNNAPIIGKTPEAMVHLDRDAVVRAVGVIFRGIDNVEDASLILNDLGTNGGRGLLKGLRGIRSQNVALRLEDGALTVSPGLLADPKFTDRLFLFKHAQDRGYFAEMKSLVGPTFDIKHFMVELDSVINQSAQELYGLRRLNILPEGTETVRLRQDGQDWYVVMLDKDGKELGHTPAMAKEYAGEVYKNIQESQRTIFDSASYKLGGIPRFLSSVQRGFLSDMFLHASPTHWIRNGVSAAITTTADRIFTFDSTDEIISKMIDRVGAAYDLRTLEAVAGETVTAGPGLDMAGHQQHWTEKFRPGGIPGYTPLMKKLATIWTGNNTVPFTGGRVALGEANYGLRAVSKAIDNALVSGWHTVVNGAPFSRFKSIEQRLIKEAGLSPELAKHMARGLYTHGINGNATTLKNFVNTILDNNVVVKGLADLDIDPRLLSTESWREIDQLLIEFNNLANPQQRQAFAAQFNAKVFNIFQKDKVSLGRRLNAAPPPPTVDVFMSKEITGDAAQLVDDLTVALRNTGMSAPEARLEANKFASAWNKQQFEDLNSVMEGLKHAPDGAAGRVVTLWQDIYKVKWETRKAVNRLNEIGAGGSNPKTWAWVRDQIKQAHQQEAVRIRELTQAAASDLSDPAKLAAARPSPVWDMIEHSVRYDPDVNAALRASGEFLGQAQGLPADNYAQVIEAHRQFTDQSGMVLLNVAQMHPTPDSMDILFSAMQRQEFVDAQVADKVAELRELLFANKLTPEQYYEKRNQLWAAASETVDWYNQASARAIIIKAETPLAGDVEKLAGISGNAKAQVDALLKRAGRGNLTSPVPGPKAAPGIRFVEPEKGQRVTVAGNQGTVTRKFREAVEVRFDDGTYKRVPHGDVEFGVVPSPASISRGPLQAGVPDSDTLRLAGKKSGFQTDNQLLKFATTDLGKEYNVTSLDMLSEEQRVELARSLAKYQLNEAYINAPVTAAPAAGPQPFYFPLNAADYADTSTIAVQDTLKSGGVTIAIDTKVKPAKGFAVSNDKVQTKIPIADLDPAKVADFIAAHPELQDKDVYLGLWHNKKDDMVYLDVSRVFDNQADAEKMAQQYKQIAYYDLGTGQEIQTPPIAGVEVETGFGPLVFDVSDLLGYDQAAADIDMLTNHIVSTLGRPAPPTLGGAAGAQVSQQNQVWKNLRTYVDQMASRTLTEDEMAGLARGAQKGLTQGVIPNSMSPYQRNQVTKILGDVNKEYQRVLYNAIRQGSQSGHAAMLNFADRRHFDTALAMILPFHYFWSRSAINWGKRVLQRPGMMNMVYDYRRTTQDEVDRQMIDSGYPVGEGPEKFQGTLYMGENERGDKVFRPDLLWYALPFGNYAGNAFVDPSEAASDNEKYWMMIQEYLPGFMPGYQYAMDAVFDQTSPREDGSTRTGEKFVGGYVPIYRLISDALQGAGVTDEPLPSAQSPFARYNRMDFINELALQSNMDPAVGPFTVQYAKNIEAGAPPFLNIPVEYREAAVVLYNKASQRTAQKQFWQNLNSRATGSSRYVLTEERQDLVTAGNQYWNSEYDPAAMIPPGLQGKGVQERMLSEESAPGVAAASQYLPGEWAKNDSMLEGDMPPGLNAQMWSLIEQKNRLRDQMNERVREAQRGIYNVKGDAATGYEYSDVEKQIKAEFQPQLDALDAQIKAIQQESGSQVATAQEEQAAATAGTVDLSTVMPYTGEPTTITPSVGLGDPSIQPQAAPAAPTVPATTTPPTVPDVGNKPLAIGAAGALGVAAGQEDPYKGLNPAEAAQKRQQDVFNQTFDMPGKPEDFTLEYPEGGTPEEIDAYYEAKAENRKAWEDYRKKQEMFVVGQLVKPVTLPNGVVIEGMKPGAALKLYRDHYSDPNFVEEAWARTNQMSDLKNEFYDLVDEAFDATGQQNKNKKFDLAYEYLTDPANRPLLNELLKGVDKKDPPWWYERYKGLDTQVSGDTIRIDGKEYPIPRGDFSSKLDQAAGIWGDDVYAFMDAWDSGMTKEQKNALYKKYPFGRDFWAYMYADESEEAGAATGGGFTTPRTGGGGGARAGAGFDWDTYKAQAPGTKDDWLRANPDQLKLYLDYANSKGYDTAWIYKQGSGGGRTYGGGGRTYAPSETAQARQVIQGTYGAEGVALLNEYLSMSPGARSKFRADNPDVREVLLYGYNPEGAQQLEEMFGEDIVPRIAAIPVWDGSEQQDAARKSYFDANPDVWEANQWLRGRPGQESDDSEFNDNGTDYAAAQELFGDDVWDKVLAYRRGERGGELEDTYRAWADFWYEALPDNSVYGSGSRSSYRSSDGLVTFDRFGRRLDSLGHVARGSYGGGGGGGGGGYGGGGGRYATEQPRALFLRPNLEDVDIRSWRPMDDWYRTDWQFAGRDLGPEKVRGIANKWS